MAFFLEVVFFALLCGGLTGLVLFFRVKKEIEQVMCRVGQSHYPFFSPLPRLSKDMQNGSYLREKGSMHAWKKRDYRRSLKNDRRYNQNNEDLWSVLMNLAQSHDRERFKAMVLKLVSFLSIPNLSRSLRVYDSSVLNPLLNGSQVMFAAQRRPKGSSANNSSTNSMSNVINNGNMSGITNNNMSSISTMMMNGNNHNTNDNDGSIQQQSSHQSSEKLMNGSSMMDEEWVLKLHNYYGLAPIYTDPLFYHKSKQTQEIQTRRFKLGFRAFDRLCDLIIRDFLDYWFTPSVTGEDYVREHKFFDSVRRLLHNAFNILAVRSSEMRWINFLTRGVIQEFTQILGLFQGHYNEELKKYIRRVNQQRRVEQGPDEPVTTFTESMLTKEMKEEITERTVKQMIRESVTLHDGSKNERMLLRFLRKISDQILEEIMDDRDYDCIGARVFLIEVFTNNIIFPCVGFADSYYINYAIWQTLEPRLKDPKEKEEEMKQQRMDEDDRWVGEGVSAGDRDGDEDKQKSEEESEYHTLVDSVSFSPMDLSSQHPPSQIAAAFSDVIREEIGTPSQFVDSREGSMGVQRKQQENGGNEDGEHDELLLREEDMEGRPYQKILPDECFDIYLRVLAGVTNRQTFNDVFCCETESDSDDEEEEEKEGSMAGGMRKQSRASRGRRWRRMRRRRTTHRSRGSRSVSVDTALTRFLRSNAGIEYFHVFSDCDNQNEVFPMSVSSSERRSTIRLSSISPMAHSLGYWQPFVARSMDSPQRQNSDSSGIARSGTVSPKTQSILPASSQSSSMMNESSSSLPPMDSMGDVSGFVLEQRSGSSGFHSGHESHSSPDRSHARVIPMTSQFRVQSGEVVTVSFITRRLIGNLCGRLVYVDSLRTVPSKKQSLLRRQALVSGPLRSCDSQYFRYEWSERIVDPDGTDVYLQLGLILNNGHFTPLTGVPLVKFFVFESIRPHPFGVVGDSMEDGHYPSKSVPLSPPPKVPAAPAPRAPVSSSSQSDSPGVMVVPASPVSIPSNIVSHDSSVPKHILLNPEQSLPSHPASMIGNSLLQNNDVSLMDGNVPSLMPVSQGIMSSGMPGMSEEVTKKFHHDASDITMRRGTVEMLINHEFTAKLRASITDYYADFAPEKYTAYTATFTDGRHLRWELKTRYSRLHAFDKELRSTMKDAKVVAKFPSRTWLSSKFDNRRVDQRRNDLERYLKNLCENKTVRQSPSFRDLMVPPRLVAEFEFEEIRKQQEKAELEAAEQARLSEVAPAAEQSGSSVVRGRGTALSAISAIGGVMSSTLSSAAYSTSSILRLGGYQQKNGLIKSESSDGTMRAVSSVSGDDSSKVSSQKAGMLSQRMSEVVLIPGEGSSQMRYRRWSVCDCLVLPDQRSHSHFSDEFTKLFSDNSRQQRRRMMRKKNWNLEKARLVIRHLRNEALKHRKRARNNHSLLLSAAATAAVSVVSDLDKLTEVKSLPVTRDVLSSMQSDTQKKKKSKKRASLSAVDLSSSATVTQSSSRSASASQPNESALMESSSTNASKADLKRSVSDEQSIGMHSNHIHNDDSSSLMSDHEFDQSQYLYTELTQSITDLMECILRLSYRTQSLFGASMQLIVKKLVKWFFSGKIQRILHGFINSKTFDRNLQSFIQFVLDSVWPDGEFVEFAPPLTEDDRMKAKVKSEAMLEMFIAEHLPYGLTSVAGGREHLRECVLILHRLLQNDQLLRHLICNIIQTFIDELFPVYESRSHLRLECARRFRHLMQKQQAQLKKIRDELNSAQ